MSDELAKKKAAAAAKAKAAALRKQQEKEVEEKSPEEIAKAKAAAAAKAKAAALRKQRKKEVEEKSPEEIAKAKAAAAAKAKAAALRKQREKEVEEKSPEEIAKAKAAAVAKAKAAAAAKARTKAGGEEQVEEKPPPPSINEPLLNKYIKMIQERIGDEALEAAYINRLAKEVPTLVAKKETYFQVAQCLKEQLHFDYLSDSHGIDYETHMELYNHLYSFTQKENVVLKVKLERDEPVIPSLTPLWQGANWPERETYDLLGITFTEHPNLTRIMMPDSWVGHPLRKDYEPHDEEV